MYICNQSDSEHCKQLLKYFKCPHHGEHKEIKSTRLGKCIDEVGCMDNYKREQIIVKCIEVK